MSTLVDNFVTKGKKKDQENIYKCDVCDKSFVLIHTLKRHFKIIHNDCKGSSCKCDHCGKTFLSKGHLRRHVESKHDIRIVPRCDQCKKPFSSNDRNATYVIDHFHLNLRCRNIFNHIKL